MEDITTNERIDYLIACTRLWQDDTEWKAGIDGYARSDEARFPPVESTPNSTFARNHIQWTFFHGSKELTWPTISMMEVNGIARLYCTSYILSLVPMQNYSRFLFTTKSSKQAYLIFNYALSICNLISPYALLFYAHNVVLKVRGTASDHTCYSIKKDRGSWSSA